MLPAVGGRWPMEAETESTGTSAEEAELCATRGALAEGLLGLLKPTVDRLDDAVRATRISQVELKQELDSVLDELKKISESQKKSPELDEYVKKLMNSKQRITVISALLQTSQERLNRIHQMAAKETAKRLTLVEDAPVASSSNQLPDAES